MDSVWEDLPGPSSPQASTSGTARAPLGSSASFSERRPNASPSNILAAGRAAVFMKKSPLEVCTTEVEDHPPTSPSPPQASTSAPWSSNHWAIAPSRRLAPLCRLGLSLDMKWVGRRGRPTPEAQPTPAAQARPTARAEARGRGGAARLRRAAAEPNRGWCRASKGPTTARMGRSTEERRGAT